MSSATIRNERCAVVLVEHEDEARLVVRAAENTLPIRGVEAIGFGDKGSAVLSYDSFNGPDGDLDGLVLIANVRGLLVLLAEVEQVRLDDPSWAEVKAHVRLFLEDAIAGLAS